MPWLQPPALAATELAPAMPTSRPAAATGCGTSFECGACRARGKQVVELVLSRAVLTGLAAYSTHSAFQDGVSEWGDDMSIGHLLKSFILYLQYTVVVGSLGLSWPAPLARVYRHSVAWLLNPSQVTSVDCLLSLGSTPLAVQRLIVHLATPLAILGLLLGAWCFKFAFANRSASAEKRAAPAGWAFVIPLVVIFYFYPSLVKEALGIFACYPLKEMRAKFWVYSMDTQCYTGWHLTLAYCVGVPLSLFFVVVLPAGSALYLHRHAGRLHEPAVKKKAGFLYRRYSNECYYWESVVNAQIAALVAVAVFGRILGSYYQLVLVAITVFLALTSYQIKKPLRSKDLERVEETGLFCVLLTCLVSMCFVDSPEYSISAASEVGVAAVILAVNCGYVAMVGVCVFKVPEVRRVLSKLRRAMVR